MTTNQIIEIIGAETENRITAGIFGDTSIHANGFLTGDPCYFLPPLARKEFSEAAIKQQPDAYNGIIRHWVSIIFRGRTCYFRTCSDGVGPLNHCIDSGWVVAIPAFAI